MGPTGVARRAVVALRRTVTVLAAAAVAAQHCGQTEPSGRRALQAATFGALEHDEHLPGRGRGICTRSAGGTRSAGTELRTQTLALYKLHLLV